jgi:hypothetical protein
MMGHTPDNTQIWGFIRSKIEHEHKWIQERVSWNLASTAFLLGAYGSLLSYVHSLKTSSWLAPVLVIGIPVLGVTISVLVLAGLAAAWMRQKDASSEWQRLVPDEEIRDRFPDLRSRAWALWLGRISSWGTTLAALIAWLALLAAAVF